MTKDAFKDRERALENEFFRRVDNKLLADLKAKLATDAERQRMSALLGFDETLVDELIAVGISSEAVAAMALVPLVLVAWADGKVDKKERPAILKAAREQGIAVGSAGRELLNHWLDTPPDPQLATTWNHYVQAVTEQLDDEARHAMRNEIVSRASKVAQACGGTLGIGAVSASEQQVISAIEAAFDQ